MLLTVMLLSGAILGATSLAGLLVLFQLRQTSDIKASTQAIIAADAGIECAYMVRFEGGIDSEPDASSYSSCTGTFENGARYEVVSEDGKRIKSVGKAGRSARAFEIRF